MEPFIANEKEYGKTYLEELNLQSLRIIPYLSLIGSFIWLPYIFLDKQLFPQEMFIPYLRVGFSLVSLLSFYLYFVMHHKYKGIIIITIFGSYLEITTGVITGLTQIHSVYMGGYIFVLLLSLVAPVPKWISYAVITISVSTFFIVAILNNTTFSDPLLWYSLNDLTATLILVFLFIYLLDKFKYYSYNKSRKVEIQNKKIMEEEQRSTSLLLNILPHEVAQELIQSGKVKPKYYEKVSILFADFVGFTSISEELSVKELINNLDGFFSYFDLVAQNKNLEKLKTIGDAYMCAGGLPTPNKTHAIDCVLAALELQAFLFQMKNMYAEAKEEMWELRIGINTGPVIAGIIGETKFSYDIWGDAVNIASRMESSGEAWRVNISDSTYQHVKEYFHCEFRDKIKAKGKGYITMYFVNGLKAEYSVNGEGKVPNQKFLHIYNKLKIQI